VVATTERREKTKGKKRRRESGVETVGERRKQSRRRETILVVFPNLAQKTRNIVGTGRAYSNRRNRKNKCSSS